VLSTWCPESTAKKGNAEESTDSPVAHAGNTSRATPHTDSDRFTVAAV
jgi:hypothetical protein